jgi:hypothetical protein
MRFLKINRSQIINYLIRRYKYKTYLEIGIRNPVLNFDKVKCKYKEGIDPDPLCGAKFVMTSDDFFKTLPLFKKYDIIFIDGLHMYKQVVKDIENSLNHLSMGGTIVLHDCNPMKKERQVEKRLIHHKKWNGTVWKAFAELRINREDLFMYVVDRDEGVGIIRRGFQNLFKKTTEKKLTYDFLKKNRKNLLKLCSIKKFKKIN